MAVRNIFLNCVLVIFCTCHFGRVCEGLQTTGRGEYLIHRFRCQLIFEFSVLDLIRRLALSQCLSCLFLNDGQLRTIFHKGQIRCDRMHKSRREQTRVSGQ